MATIKCSVTKSSWYEMYIEYSIQGDATNNKSKISHSLKLKQLTDTYDFSGTMDVTYYVAGTKYSFNDTVDIDDKGNKGYIVTIKSGTTTISHDTKGDASFKVSCSGSCNSGGWGPGTISLSETTVKCPRLPIFKLSISAGTGSNITVSRTSSGGSGGTGTLSAGDNKLYYGDKLKISFSASTNYAVGTHTVNGSSFTSGNTHTVSGNVSVVSTATPLKSSIGATDANIESATAITVTRYNSSYTHTITYKFGSATGTIETKSTNTSISWTVPSSFYAQIPSSKTGSCTLTCETFNGSSSLGTTTCTFTVTASSSKCKPSVTATVTDTNTTTSALTGNSSTLVRYKSNALCSMTATPQNNATISSLSISGSSVTGSTSGGSTTGSKTYSSVSETSFKFVATDSRGYTTEVTKTPVVVSYINLTCNPTIARPTPTSDSVELTFNGAMYTGSFGTHSNTLILDYRYKESGGSYGGWTTISNSNVVKGTNSYRSSAAILIDSGFDYRKDYEFQVRVRDGATIDGEWKTLSTVIKTITVKRGIPVFDWGEDDFNVNVPLMLKNVNILNIMYPVGAVYMHSSSTLPEAIEGIGTWSSITSGISGVYAWKRTA